MVEIGPGLAALTQPLVERLGRLTVIELDRDLAARLRQHGQLDVIESDVLKVDFAQVAQRLNAPKIRVVGNLPYNISSPILFHLLAQGHVASGSALHAAERRSSTAWWPGRPRPPMASLSVMLQWRYAMEDVLFVPPEASTRPRVDSAVVRMLPYDQPAAVDVALLSELVQVAFSQRRKLLRHTLGRSAGGARLRRTLRYPAPRRGGAGGGITWPWRAAWGRG